MSRRRDRVRNRRSKRPPDRWMLILQTGLFVGGLAFLYLFGDQIASGAGNLVSELSERPASLDHDAGADDSGAGLPKKRRAPVLERPSPPDTGPQGDGAQTD